MSEAQEQTYLFNWIAFARGKTPELDLLFHIPNEGKRDKRTGARLKAQGMRPGVPDLCLPVPTSQFHGLYIELKFGSNKPTAEQIRWLDALKRQGYKTAVCYGWEEAKDTILNYLQGGYKKTEG